MNVRGAVVAIWIAAAASGCSSSRMGASDAGSDEDCTAPGDEDGNGVADCSDPACAAAPLCAPVCGNGDLDPGEACDDGNRDDGDGCEADCTLAACGNGILDPGEACDDGNRLDGDGCAARCTLPVCGDGIPDPGEVCDDHNDTTYDACTNRCTRPVFTYIKASNTREVDDQLGWSIALSADGSTLAVGAPQEDGAAIGVNGDDTALTEPDAGAVYVYVRAGGVWRQEAYVKASNTAAGDLFGTSVALSADGSLLAVGATGESSAARGVAGTGQADDSAREAGAVYVFARKGTTWAQQAYLKASNAAAGDNFGWAVALSADGSTLAASALAEDGGASGVDGDQGDRSKLDAGAVYVFTRSGAAWRQQAYVKASTPDPRDGFGRSVALSASGSTLAVSAVVEDSAAIGVDGDQGDNSAVSAGAAYVFSREGGIWRQQAYLKASNTGAVDNFGSSVALSGDGATLAIGALGEDSAATGVDGDQHSEATQESGAAYVFTRDGGIWRQQAYLKASNTGGGDEFGWSIALSADGAMLAVGAVNEDGASIGLGGDPSDNSQIAAGAVYVFRRHDATWRQQAYVKATNSGSGDQFGSAVALSGDGGVLAVGALGESSSATGVDGDPDNDRVSSAGAAYVFQ